MNYNSDFNWLMNWFYEQCDDDWEHSNGIQIGTIDNPGWYINISLEETVLQNKDFKNIFIERSEHNWIACKKINSIFQGDCGPFNFFEMLKIFRQWAEN